LNEWQNRISIDPDQYGGHPCIHESRIRVIDILDLLAAGLKYASKKLGHPFIAA
jgi:uncharacterized protein (DUF433 family)